MIFDLHECFEDAAERAGIELRTGFDYKSMRRSLAFLLRSWANEGYNLYSIEEVTLPMVPGTYRYTLPANCIDVLEAVYRQNAATTQQVDLTLGRTSIADYQRQTNKLSAGRPNQFHVERTLIPTLVLWPVPVAVTPIVYWYMKHLVEPTAGEELPALPDRFIPALISGLAYHTAMKRPALADRVTGLASEYEKQFQLAKDEDRDRASFYITPEVTMR